MTNYGNRIKELRLEMEWTQQDLAGKFKSPMLHKMKEPRELAKMTGTRGFLMFPEGQHLLRRLSHISYFAENL